jgi:hypothetical protein
MTQESANAFHYDNGQVEQLSEITNLLRLSNTLSDKMAVLFCFA